MKPCLPMILAPSGEKKALAGRLVPARATPAEAVPLPLRAKETPARRRLAPPGRRCYRMLNATHRAGVSIVIHEPSASYFLFLWLRKLVSKLLERLAA